MVYLVGAAWGVFWRWPGRRRWRLNSGACGIMIGGFVLMYLGAMQMMIDHALNETIGHFVEINPLRWYRYNIRWGGVAWDCMRLLALCSPTPAHLISIQKSNVLMGIRALQVHTIDALYRLRHWVILSVVVEFSHLSGTLIGWESDTVTDLSKNLL